MSRRVKERRRHRQRSSRTGRATDPREKRERLLDAAVDVVRREGPAVSMERIAREAGVTKPIVYRAFGDRDGLTAAVAERFATEIAAALEVAIAEASDDRERVAGAIDSYLSFIEREPAIVRFLIHRSVGESEAVAVSGFVGRVAGIVTSALGEALRERRLDSGAAEPVAYAIVGAVHLAGDWWLDRQTMPRTRLVEYLTALVWDGLSAFDTPQQGD